MLSNLFDRYISGYIIVISYTLNNIILLCKVINLSKTDHNTDQYRNIPSSVEDWYAKKNHSTALGVLIRQLDDETFTGRSMESNFYAND